MVRLFFATEEAPEIRHVLRDDILNAPLRHKRIELLLVDRPTPLVLLESVEDVLCRSEFRDVDVLDSAHLAEKEPEVVFLREARQLRGVVQPNVNDPLDASIAEQLEEMLRSRLCEPDCEEMYAHALIPFVMGGVSDSV